MVRDFKYTHSAMPQRFFAVLIAALFAACACSFGKPTLFIIGDSTVRNSTAGQMGWGDPLVAHFDPAKIEIINRAIGGRSSRTFLTEGRWDAVMAHLKPGDFVLIQFGHNDESKEKTDRYTPPNDYRRNLVRFVGEVRAIRVAGGRPLLYHRGAYRRLAGEGEGS